MNDSIEEILEKACELHFLSLEDVRGDTAIVRYEDDVYSVDISDKHSNLRARIAGVSLAVRHGMARAQTFSEVAGRILPRVVCQDTVDGFHAMGPERLYSVEFAPGLVVTFAVEEMFAHTVLGVSAFERWGITRDRLTSAARSNLYARSTEPPIHQDLPVSHVRFQQGDSYDAGRAFILGDLFWREAQEGFFFGLPSEDLLLFAPKGLATEEERDAFEAMVGDAYDNARTPVCRGVLFYRGGVAMSALLQGT